MDIKKLRSNSKKLVVLGIMLTFFIAGAGYAAFVRTGGGEDFSYGYGYDDYGYGYGYGYRSDGIIPNNADYGFLGNDGKATNVSAIANTRGSFTVTYTTDYLAQNGILYAKLESPAGFSGLTDFQSGTNSILVTGLSCGTLYYYTVVSIDAGGNAWFSHLITPATVTTKNCIPAAPGGGGSGAVGGVSTNITNESPISVSGLQQQLTTLIAQLKAILLQLKAQGISLSAAAEAFLQGQYSFTRNLSLGMTGEDVHQLQIYLNTHGYPVASSGPGSPGNETTYFGPATRAALIKFQKASDISPAVGYFGPLTRAYVNSHP